MIVNQWKRGNGCRRVALWIEETSMGHHTLMLSLKITIMHRTKETMGFSETLRRLSPRDGNRDLAQSLSPSLRQPAQLTFQTGQAPRSIAADHVHHLTHHLLCSALAVFTM